MKRWIAECLCLTAFSTGSLVAGPVAFPQCPAAGLNTGCQFLITIGSNGTPSVAEDPNPPNNGPYDGADDTLVGVLNNSNTTVTSIPLSSPQNANGGIFAFEGDGPCTQTPSPSSCPSSTGFPGDPTGYGGPGVTYSNIAPDNMSGVVNFSPGIAPGGTAWFGLEDTLDSAQALNPGPPATTNLQGMPGCDPGTQMPEPATELLLGGGLSGLALFRRLRK